MLAQSFRFLLNNLSLVLCQPLQIVHQPVNRGIRWRVVNAPLERVTPILFFALGFGVILLQWQRFVHQRDKRDVLLLSGRVGKLSPVKQASNRPLQ